MNITRDTLLVQLPGESEWKTFAKGETFIVQKDVKFKVKAEMQVTYHCLYV